MNHSERTPDRIAQLLRQASELNESERLAAREAFLARVDSTFDGQADKRRDAGRALRTWMPPLTLAAVFFLAVYFGWPSDDLSYRVSGALSDSGYIRATSAQPATIEFTDKTLVTAEPETRLRIVELDEHGARVSLEEGKIHVQVTHEDQAAWRFVAGPFQVHVTGTRFNLGWDSTREQLSVTLHEGSVNVEGYSGSGPVEVRAGQSFFGDARTRTMQVRDATAALATSPDATSPDSAESDAEKNEPTTNTEPTSKTAPETKTSANTARQVPSLSPELSWTQLVAQGDFKKVVVQAKQRGFSACISACDAQDLSALADAARYTGQTDLAEKSLIALKGRFSASAGNRATFLLGRLYEGQGKSSEALGFYETALRQAPNGAFAPESLAGKMRMTGAVQGKAAAAKVAREYLARYPSGVHAGAARQLAQSF